MSENTLDTTINEPSETAGEAELLLFSVDRSRAQFAWKVGGLDAEALNRPHPPSQMTLGGLIKHLSFVEDDVTSRAFGWPSGAPWRAADWEADPRWEWTSAARNTPEELYAMWQDAVARSRTAWERVRTEGLDGPGKLTLPDGFTPNVRRFLVDLSDEYARHVGHADLFREAIDGLVGEDPPQPA
jgi:hypothetical protein